MKNNEIDVDPKAGRISFPLSVDQKVRELQVWWMTTGFHDLDAIIPKMFEYGGANAHEQGSADLRIIGKNIMELMGWTEASDEVVQEMGCWFYLQGKVARLISDYKHKRPGKPDTLHDSTVYTMIMRRLQEVKSWP